jgi:hypothetical protein
LWPGRGRLGDRGSPLVQKKALDTGNILWGGAKVKPDLRRALTDFTSDIIGLNTEHRKPVSPEHDFLTPTSDAISR